MGDVTRAAKNIAWIEKHCRVPDGADVGKPVVLREWQRREIEKIYNNPNGTRRAILSFGRKNGKGLALDTPIPTPDGWRLMGDIRQGDYVFGSDGKPTRVSFVSDTHTGLKCWKLKFSDGSEIIADEQHQWLTKHSYRPWAKARVNGSGNGGRPRTCVVTTPQIAISVNRPRHDGGVERNHKIEAAPATISEDIKLPIDPYVLGAWLGDGDSWAARFTVSEDDAPHLLHMLSDALGSTVALRKNKNRAPSICTPKTGLHRTLRLIGLKNNKHIPQEYFDAGTSQRWRLLQGLMDTDGTVNRHGGKTTARPTYTGINRRLCVGVWRLARSLGLKATFRESVAKLNGKVISPSYEVSFPASKESPIFSLERKQNLLPETLGKRSGTLSIVSCDPVGSVPTRCIQVEAADSLFLAGYGCVPTHNTAMSAFLLLLHLCGPEALANSQLYSAAQSREQAAILFNLAAKMVRMSETLSEFVVVRDSGKQLFCPELGTLYRALSAEASTAYGLSPCFVVHDELGQVKGPRSPLYEALETAVAAHAKPLSIVISTQAPTDGDLLSVLIDDAKTGADKRVVLSLYTADIEADAFAEETIKQANPAFGDFQNAGEVKAMAEDARRMPSREAEYRNLVLNQRVQAHNPFVSRSVWESCGGDPAPLAGELVGIGLDLSARTDLTAAVLTFEKDGLLHVHPFFWMPEEGLVERSRRDRVPYDLWSRDGYINTTPGGSVDYEYVIADLSDILSGSDLAEIRFDRWRIDVFQKELERSGLDWKMEPHGQGYKDMSPALDRLEAELLNGRLRHGMHPVLTMCAANAVVTRDPAGNRKLDKAKANGRIDGMVALAMSLSCELERRSSLNDWLEAPVRIA